jgi:hypothetical protein
MGNVTMVYPYRQINGRRAIMQAVSLEDARKTLSVQEGFTVFCEIEKPEDLDAFYSGIDLTIYVDEMLSKHETHVA